MWEGVTGPRIGNSIGTNMFAFGRDYNVPSPFLTIVFNIIFNKTALGFFSYELKKKNPIHQVNTTSFAL
jgi:hypothetical protein